MVKELRQQSFEEINFYPLEMLDRPVPEIIVNKDISSDFRITQIQKYNDFFISEIALREKIINKFKNIDFFCFIAEMLLVIFDIVLGSFGLIFPTYLSTTSSVCIIATTISTFIRGITKKIMQKLEKHQHVLILTKNKFSTVKDKYHLAIRDGTIDHEEYVSIVDDFKSYDTLRTEILT